MQDEFDVMTGTVTPTLSFGVQPEPELPAEKKPEEVKPAEPVDDSILSDPHISSYDRIDHLSFYLASVSYK